MMPLYANKKGERRKHNPKGVSFSRNNKHAIGSGQVDVIQTFSSLDDEWLLYE